MPNFEMYVKRFNGEWEYMGLFDSLDDLPAILARIVAEGAIYEMRIERHGKPFTL